MTRTHWLIFAGFMTALGTQIVSLESWEHAITPMFVGGVIGQLALFIVAMFKDSPTNGGK